MRLSSSSAEEFLGVSRGTGAGVGSTCGWGGGVSFIEETGLVDGLKKTFKKHMIVYYFYFYICSRQRNESEMNMSFSWKDFEVSN